MSAEGWRYWINDMQECTEGDHGGWWQERFEQAAVAAAQGQTAGSWQEWRDIRLAEKAPDVDACPHDWLLRPESDTRECLICGEERLG